MSTQEKAKVGRPVKTAEMRAASVPEAARVKLLVALEARNAARDRAAIAEVQLVDVVQEVVTAGVSLRDVAMTLGAPHQSVHGWLTARRES